MSGGHTVGEDNHTYWYVLCYECGGSVYGDADKEKSAEAWNRRANDVRPVVRGEWIETGYFDQAYQPIYECSHCHREVADNFIEKHLFCLHCGADMRTIGQRLSDISAEEDLFPELTAEEKAENKAEAKRMVGGADGWATLTESVI